MLKFGLISEISEAKLSKANLEKLASALTIQGTTHFSKHWAKSGMMQVFDSVNSLPEGYVPFYIQEEIDVKGVEAYHWSSGGKPYGKIKFNTDWDDFCRFTGHEFLETIANPDISRFSATEELEIIGRKGKAYFEVCDICQSKETSYRINGIMVSNFVTPNYFDLTKTKGLQFDYLGLVTYAGEILEGGYRSWDIGDSEVLQAYKVKGQLVWKRLTGDKEVIVAANSQPFTWGIPAIAASIFILAIFLIIGKK